MKTRFLAVLLLVGATALTSCVRDEDLDLLRHPIHVQGEVDPHLGVPIAKGEMTLNDILTMLSSSYTGMLNPDSNTITICYDASVNDVINAGSFIGMSTKGTLVSIDTMIGYTVPINLFDDVSMQNIVNGNIDINHMWVKLDVNLEGHCGNASQGMKDTINSFVSAVFDSLVITYEDHNGNVHTHSNVTMTPPVVRLDTIVDHRKNFTILCDMAEIVNSMPRRVSANLRFRFDIDESIFGLSFSNIEYFTQLMDSIKLTQLFYGADLHVEFPFDIHIGSLPYSFTLDLGEEGLSQLNLDSLLSSLGEGVDMELKDSELNLRFENGIPMDLRISAWLLDQNDLPNGGPIITDTTIHAARTRDVGDNTSEAYEAWPTTVTLPMNAELLERLGNTRKIRFDMLIKTPDGHVKVKKDDYLRVEAYVKLHPSVTFDIPLGGSGSDHNDK